MYTVVVDKPELNEADSPFGARLRAAGYKPATLAKKCGVKPAAMSHWITGKRAPTYPNLVKLSKGLRVSVSTVAKDFGL